MEALTHRQFFSKWFIRCGIGELLSVSIATTIIVIYRYAFGEPNSFSEGSLLMLIMLLSGLVQGLILGWFQWSVLRYKFTLLKMRDWLAYTIISAVVCWIFGMIPLLNSNGGDKETVEKEVVIKEEKVNTDKKDSTTENLKIEKTKNEEPGNKFNLLTTLLLGFSIGAVFGIFQWLSLRSHSKRAYFWIISNVISWMLAMVIVFWAYSITEPVLPILLIVGVLAAALVLASGAIAFINGSALLIININPIEKKSEIEGDILG
jgi:hypothetical protein